jgi:hypothetical protein
MSRTFCRRAVPISQDIDNTKVKRQVAQCRLCETASCSRKMGRNVTGTNAVFPIWV